MNRFIFVFFFLAAQFLQAAELPVEFKQWFEQGLKGKTAVTASVVQAARNKHFVFVYGFNNETMPAYFTENVKTLRKLGGNDLQIDFIQTRSSKGLSENIKLISGDFAAVLKKSNHPLIIIGHSRGGSHAVIWAMNHPKEVSERVHALISVNGAFGGTLMADYLLGINRNVSKMSWGDWAAFKAWATAAMVTVPLNREGFKELTTPASLRFWTGFLKSHAEAIPTVSPKLFYVQASTATVNMAAVLKPPGDFIAQTGASDGIILFDDQRLRTLGTTLFNLEGDHHDLVHGRPAAGSLPVVRQAFSYAIFQLAGQP